MIAERDYVSVTEKGNPLIHLKGHESFSFFVNCRKFAYTGNHKPASAEEMAAAFEKNHFQFEIKEDGIRIWDDKDEIEIRAGKVFINGERFLSEGEKKEIERQRKRAIIKDARKTLQTYKAIDESFYTLDICKANKMLQLFSKMK